ncbi:ATP12 family protein [Xanthobacter sp. VNH20]|uniref:ATP12 family chaperone protein n=1 Tax=Xanthobacter sp. VNH20 TaxID=3156616 RepID=UPI0032B54FD1
MRDLLEGIETTGIDPAESVRAAQRVTLPKRFYKAASVGTEGDGFTILLDGRPVRTPARDILHLPTRALAEAVAAEWDAQVAEINPHAMPLTRLVNVVLDGVMRDPTASAAEVVSYAGTDLLCYRADGPERLEAQQAQAWDPVLDWFRDHHSARFFLSTGVRHVKQPDETLARIADLVPREPFRLAAVTSMTALTGSALLALAVAHGAIDAETAWTAAHVDEAWNRAQWGEDELAAARHAARKLEMDAAARLLALLD